MCLGAIIGGVIGGGTAYLAGGNIWVGIGVGALGGAVGAFPAATVGGTLAVGAGGGAIGGSAGAISKGELPSRSDIGIGILTGGLASGTGGAIKAITASEVAAQGISNMPGALTGFIDAGQSRRRGDSKLIWSDSPKACH